MVISLTKFILPDQLEEAPVRGAPLITPMQGIEQTSLSGDRDRGSLTHDLQTHRRRARVAATGAIGKVNVSIIIRGPSKISEHTSKVITTEAQPGQPHSGLSFHNWAVINLTSSYDVFKPVVCLSSPLTKIFTNSLLRALNIRHSEVVQKSSMLCL